MFIRDRTVDGGQTWDALTGGSGGWLNSVFFTDENTGYSVGSNGTIQKITNGLFVSNHKMDKPVSNMNIYPNPANKNLTITFMNEYPEIFTLIISDIHGKQILNRYFQNKERVDLDISGLPKNIYFVKVLSEGNVETSKLVIW